MCYALLHVQIFVFSLVFGGGIKHGTPLWWASSVCVVMFGAIFPVFLDVN